MRTSRKYTRELKKQFGYIATWLPGTPLELGDVGVFKKNQFTKISNLSDFNIPFEIEPDTTKSDIEHSSEGAVSITTKASGTVAPQGSALAEVDAGIIVQFSKEKAILFKVIGTLSPSIKNQIALGNTILGLYREGRWDKDWAIITELVNADSGTILISSSSSGKIELKAKADVEAVKLDIADASLDLGVSYSKDLSTKIIADEGLTPLFKASMVRSRFILKPKFEMNFMKSMDLMTPDKAKQEEDSIYFGEVEFDYEDDE